MLFNDLTGHITHVLETHTRVVRALGSWETTLWETQRTPVLIQEILLLKTKPGAFIIKNRRTIIRRMRRHAIGHHHFAHHQHTILPRGIRINGDRLQHAIGALAFRLLRGASIKSPERQLGERREAVVFFDLRLAAQVTDGLITVQPEVFEFVFGHGCLSDVVRNLIPVLNLLSAYLGESPRPW